MLRPWPVKELAEQADGPNECVEVVRGVCAFAWNFSVARPGGDKTLDPSWRCRWISDSPLVNRLKIPPAKNHALYYTYVIIINPGCAFYAQLREQITPHVVKHTQLIPRWPHTQQQLTPRVANESIYSTGTSYSTTDVSACPSWSIMNDGVQGLQT
jgi:hypothetical protein